ncbi:MAG: alpha/beta hydrolase [Caldilineaceae bacterium]|nr:alpha/beta hydrolase [Caldilineaceae bacterium]
MKIQTQLIQLSHGTIHVATAGSGSPLLLLHGGGIDSAQLSWAEAIAPFAERYRVYAPDWPGYGKSDPLPGEGYGIERLVNVLAELIDALDLPQVSLVGISMGGGASLGYALTYPQRVANLVLVDSYGLCDSAPFHRLSYWVTRLPAISRWTYGLMRRSRWLTRWGVRAIFAGPVPEAVVDESFAALQLANAGEPFIAFQRSELRPDRLNTCYAQRLGELSMPVLLIHGDQDTLVPLSAAQEAAQQIPNARLEVMAMTGHWPPRERPAQFNAAVLAFLKEGDW